MHFLSQALRLAAVHEQGHAVVRWRVVSARRRNASTAQREQSFVSHLIALLLLNTASSHSPAMLVLLSSTAIWPGPGSECHAELLLLCFFCIK